MLEKLPEALGHALRDTRAGLDKLAYERTPLRSGMGALSVGSLAFADHAPIPAAYTADGEGVSPPLHWTGVPTGCATLVLIVEDADAPTPQPLVHAIVVNLPPADGRLSDGALSDDTTVAQALAVASAGSEEGADTSAVMSSATAPAITADAAGTPDETLDEPPLQLGRNSLLQTRWLAPDPPPGHGVHRYAFQLFALNATPEFSAKPGREELLKALADHAIASGCLIGTYQRADGSQRTGSHDELERADAAPGQGTMTPIAFARTV